MCELCRYDNDVRVGSSGAYSLQNQTSRTSLLPEHLTPHSCILRQVLTLPRLASSSLCSWKWPRTSNPPASTSQHRDCTYVSQCCSRKSWGSKDPHGHLSTPPVEQIQSPINYHFLFFSSRAPSPTERRTEPKPRALHLSALPLREIPNPDHNFL